MIASNSQTLESDFSDDIHILTAYTDFVASTLINAENHKKLQEELAVLKNIG